MGDGFEVSFLGVLWLARILLLFIMVVVGIGLGYEECGRYSLSCVMEMVWRGMRLRTEN